MSGAKNQSAESSRVVGRLKFYFATLSCLGGLVLSVGSETETIPVIAVFFAVFGYVFVDTLKLFALPPIAAYAAMALAALYCVSDFVDLDAPGNHQMVAVARLLVFVQAILMLQKKSRRIFEQLGVFCLLQLIVAAVFNNAINYGLLLIPIGVIGAFALSLLTTLAASEGLGAMEGLDSDDDGTGFRSRPKRSQAISVTSPESIQSLTFAALRMPKIALLTLAPAVALVGAMFFYALPRTTDAAIVRSPGKALVGFSEDVHLEQIGQMMQSTQVALRLYLTDRATGQPYRLSSGVYVRGRVLDDYTPQLSSTRNSAKWTMAQRSLRVSEPALPREYLPQRASDRNFYDSVKVTLICEPMRSPALFAVAPYYRVKRAPEIVHYEDRWTIRHRSDNDSVYPRKGYSFGTNAFRLGTQTELLARRSTEPLQLSDDSTDEQARLIRRRLWLQDERSRAYVTALLEYDEDSIPSAKSISDELIKTQRTRPTTYQTAKILERYLATSRDFQYTLNLNAKSVLGVDPIEQFLSVDRKGHCQYYASALAMMLRSQDIPARIVVGYHTDEFNELQQHYVARQLHAHAWVEALIDRDQLNASRNIYGQPTSGQYWLRLDPTPAAGRIRESDSGVAQMLDVAQNVWDDYVVDMDSEIQDNALMGGGLTPMTNSYDQLVDWLSLTISRVRAGELGGGSLASRRLFSWPAAVLGGLLAIMIVLLLRFRMPNWIRRTMRPDDSADAAVPKIDFYAETLKQLERVGIERRSSQTPAELATVASESLQHPMVPPIREPLDLLTASFYRVRFGRNDHGKQNLEMPDPVEQDRHRNAKIDQALSQLKQSIDLMVDRSEKTEQAP